MRSPRSHALWVNEDCPHFITTNTLHRESIFENPELARRLMEEFHHYAVIYDVELIVLTVMPDHLHCIVWPHGKRNFSEYMKGVKGYFARIYTEWLRDHGEVLESTKKIWQDGFFDYLILTDEKLEEKIEYVLNNPVEAGIVGRWREYPFIYLNADYKIE